MDTLRITDLELWTPIGTTDEERTSGQRLLVSLEWPTNASAVAEDDDLSEGTDYALVRMKLLELATTERRTIERFAEDVSTMMLQDFALTSVTVTVQKFPFADVGSVQVNIIRP